MADEKLAADWMKLGMYCLQAAIVYQPFSSDRCCVKAAMLCFARGRQDSTKEMADDARWSIRQEQVNICNHIELPESLSGGLLDAAKLALQVCLEITESVLPGDMLEGSVYERVTRAKGIVGRTVSLGPDLVALFESDSAATTR